MQYKSEKIKQVTHYEVEIEFDKSRRFEVEVTNISGNDKPNNTVRLISEEMSHDIKASYEKAVENMIEKSIIKL